MVLPELASVRITAYEESGKFIGHRVLPVIGLCPGYRHVNLRNEMGQPLALATLFLCLVVKDYVPDGLSDFAEALANPIKYQSELEKRSEQLAVLTEDTEPIPEDDSMCEDAPTANAQRATLPRGQLSVADGDSEAGAACGAAAAPDVSMSSTSTHPAASSSSYSSSATQQHHSTANNSAFSNNIPSTSAAASSAAAASSVTYGGAGGVGATAAAASSSSAATASSSALQGNSQQSASTAVAASESSAASSSTAAKSAEAIEADAIAAEPLESILANKAVREKRMEMEKKLESLRKKHDKEKLRICSSPKAGESSSEKKSKFMGNKLVKRLSSKNM